jgi:transposase-like protein
MICAVRGQWVFGGVERESGRTFLVPVTNSSADTLMTFLRAWVEPGTTVISDSWAAYRDLDAQGYTHRTVNHTISFVNEKGDHTNTIQSKWGHVKAKLRDYKKAEDYIYHFAHYLFAAKCKAEEVDQFTTFLHIAATTDWSTCSPAHPLGSHQ